MIDIPRKRQSQTPFVSSVFSILKDFPHEDPFLIRTLYGIGNGLAGTFMRSLIIMIPTIMLH